MTSTIDFLLSRQSNGNLTEPAPNKAELEQILQSAMSVPDHAGLTPWRITIVEGDARQTLANAYVASVKASGADEAKLAKAERMPFRAPLLVIVSTAYQEHPKVPKIEQSIAAGCAVHAMQMAAVALGFNAMWRTGDLAFCDVVKQHLAIETENDIVGYLYIGTEAKTLPNKPRKSFSEVTRYL
ncbi:MAG: nitroreductase family protein [Thalassotalea sp.]|nr:nitroreductase family protein [Thalassotalea sp.]